MTSDIAAAMRRATDLTRAFDLAGATKVIQQALAGRPLASAEANCTDRDAQSLQLAGPDQTPTPKVLGNRILVPLAEAIRTLKEGREKVLRAPVARHAKPGVPDGAQFIARTYTCSDGTRQFKLFIPNLAGSAPKGLILMLHGCKQTPDDFAVGTKMNEIAASSNLVVAYPSQPSSANAGACWNWFVPAHQMRDRGEPAILAGLTRELMKEFGFMRDQVFVAGLSAGGAMAAVLLETYPDVFSAGGIHSGLAYGSANDVMSAFAVMRGDAVAVGNRSRAKPIQPSRVIIFHGDADGTVHPKNARRILLERVGPDCAASVMVGEINGQKFTKEVFAGNNCVVESWLISGAGHAWSGGDARGSYASSGGPDASAEMARFFLN